MAGQASTQLAAPSATQAGASLILSADVQGLTADSPTPTGSVDFYDDTTGTPVLLGSGELNASGEAVVLVPQGLTSGSIAHRGRVFGRFETTPRRKARRR